MAKNKKIEQQIQFTENKYFIWVAFISFILCVFFIVSYKITFDDDFFWHLANGRFIVENKYVPNKDVFGHVTSGTDWIPFEWGWDVLTYSLYDIGGYNAILVFRSLLYCLLFLLYLRVLKKLNVNTGISLIILFALMFAMMDRFSARPHVMSYFFIVLMLYIYLPFKYSNRDNNIKRLYFFPLIFLIWANMHMGVLIGGLLLFLLVISEIIIYYFPSKFSSNDIKPISKNHLAKLLIISGICAIMLLVNPHTYNTYLYTYGHLQMKLMNSIAEWQNPFTGQVDFNFINTLYKIFVLSGIIIIIYSFLKKDLTAFLVCIVFTIHSVRAIRYTVDYEVVVIPFLIISIDYFLKIISSKKLIFGKIMYSNVFKIVLIIILTSTAIFAENSKIYDFLKYYRVSGWGINENYTPVKVFNFIKDNNIKGTPINQYEQGGYLIWTLPDQKNFIDSRALSDEIYDEYNSIFYMKPGFDKKLDKYGIDYMVFYDPELTLNPKILSKNIAAYFSNNENWKLVYWDDQSMLFLKNVPKFADIINKNNYLVLNPLIALFQPKLFEELIINNAEQTKIEINRKVKSEQNGYFFRTMLMVTSKYIR